MVSNCPSCNKEVSLGHHWAQSNCDYPDLSKQQSDALTGALMGDGTVINYSHAHPSLKVVSTTQEYLEYLDNLLGPMSTGVRKKMTAKESAKEARDSGFDVSADEKSYSDVYVWTTRSSPKLSVFLDWYDNTKGKIWPESITLSPEVLKNWYCCDGNYKNKSYIRISLSNEKNEKRKVENYFKKANIPLPSRWETSKKKEYSDRCSICWTVSQSNKLFDYMGEPLPGFEYKWPDRQTS